MVLSNFQSHDLMLMFASVACIAVSILMYVYNRSVIAIILLIIGAFGLRIFMAHLDPYLWDWDERYHVMVAKNLLQNPLRPSLYSNPILPYDYTNWTANEIWVHKQPLGLWQIALSFWLFGVNQFTARIPMAVEGAILVWFIYRIGVITVNKNVGYLSALFYAVSFYALDFMTGGQATDHVDYALVFYVSASLWAFIEYRQHYKLKWFLLIGIFAGLAVLSKWTIGLLVFPAWFIVVLSDKEERKLIGSYLLILKAFIISVIVFLPWQLYCLIHYPLETKYEMAYNSSHLLTEVDGRGETKWYYLEQLAHNYGPPVPYIIGFALLFMWRYIKRRDYKIFIFSTLIITYFLFSIIAATKMPAYCYIACIPVVLAMGSLLWCGQQYIAKRKLLNIKWIICLGLMLIAIFSINFYGIAKRHSGYDPNNVYRINKVRYTDYFRKIKNEMPKDYVVFGTQPGWEIEMMFYTGNTCYPNIPDLEKYTQLKARNIKMAIVKSDKAPDYMLNDKDVLKVSAFPQ